MYIFGRYSIREDMLEALVRYRDMGIDPGDFLNAIIENDLVAAVGAADEGNMDNLPAYAAYLYMRMPRESWGSRERRAAWQAAQFERWQAREAARPPAQEGEETP